MSRLFRQFLGPFLLILCCPPLVMMLAFTNINLNGSMTALWQMISSQGLISVLYQSWGMYFFGSVFAWRTIIIFVLFQYGLLRFLPGPIYNGPVTAKGNVPQYTANGFSSYLITLCSYVLISFGLNLFNPAQIYDHFLEILGALNAFSLMLCLALYFKGRFLPSSSDSGSIGHFIFDYYWGTELYPMLGKINLKMFINCRLGMMSWAVIIISFATKQYQLSGLSQSMMVCVGLQLYYITKFFIWETGYLASLDIMHDRAGYYICWGCLVWVPGFYTSPTLYLVNHPVILSDFLAYGIFITGVVAISINYLADRQRQMVRKFNGNCRVWGKPPRLTVARYATIQGVQKQSLLLASGWWGISRHFHYLPEIFGAFCWSVPALFNDLMPYLYLMFLTVLLFDRAFRDDKRCLQKYGEDWLNYCKLVPYKIVPFVI